MLLSQKFANTHSTKALRDYFAVTESHPNPATLVLPPGTDFWGEFFQVFWSIFLSFFLQIYLEYSSTKVLVVLPPADLRWLFSNSSFTILNMIQCSLSFSDGDTEFDNRNGWEE